MCRSSVWAFNARQRDSDSARTTASHGTATLNHGGWRNDDKLTYERAESVVETTDLRLLVIVAATNVDRLSLSRHIG